jgi:hypothetical protein
MPPGALAAAEAAGKKLDVLYCLAMLEEAQLSAHAAAAATW